MSAWFQRAGSSRSIQAAAVIIPPAAHPDDAVVRTILDGDVPQEIFQVRQKLTGLGGSLATHIVANRGFHNPAAGSFSFFEAYTGPMKNGTVQFDERLRLCACR